MRRRRSKRAPGAGHAAKVQTDAYRDCWATAVDLAVREAIRAANADPLARVDDFLAIGGFVEIARRAVDAACAQHGGQVAVRALLCEPQELVAIINEVKARMRGGA